MRTAFLCLVLLSLGACSAASETERAAKTVAVSEEVITIAENIVSAVRSDDVAATIAHNAPDYEFYSHGLPNVAGADAARANIEAMLADPEIRFGLDGDIRVDVSEAGDMAVLSAMYDWAYSDPATGEAVPERGNWVLIFKRQADGSMMVWREIATDVPLSEV